MKIHFRLPTKIYKEEKENLGLLKCLLINQCKCLSRRSRRSCASCSEKSKGRAREWRFRGGSRSEGGEGGDIGSENDNNYSRAVCHERSITRRQLTLKNRLESRTIRFPKDHPSSPLPLPLPSFSPLNPPPAILDSRGTKVISAPPAFSSSEKWKDYRSLLYIRSP